jgi:hypothetical protein
MSGGRTEPRVMIVLTIFPNGGRTSILYVEERFHHEPEVRERAFSPT